MINCSKKLFGKLLTKFLLYISIATISLLSTSSLLVAQNISGPKSSPPRVVIIDPTTGVPVTQGAFCEFLNNVTESQDSHKLYDESMNDDATALVLINRSENSGSYSYSVVPGQEDTPMIAVGSTTAKRFYNWRCNGKLSHESKAIIQDDPNGGEGGYSNIPGGGGYSNIPGGGGTNNNGNSGEGSNGDHSGGGGENSGGGEGGGGGGGE